jgi:hypothetical protein
VIKAAKATLKTPRAAQFAVWRFALAQIALLITNVVTPDTAVAGIPCWREHAWTTECEKAILELLNNELSSDGTK